MRVALLCLALMWAAPASAQGVRVRTELESAELRGHRHALLIEEAGSVRRSRHEVGTWGAFFEDRRLYFAEWAGQLFAIDVVRDEVRWRQNHPGEVCGIERVEQTTLALVWTTEQGMRAHTRTRRIAAMDVRDGRLVWEHSHPTYFSAVRIAGNVIVLRAEDGLVALDARSGRERWRLPLIACRHDDCGNDITGYYGLELGTDSLVEMEAPRVRLVDMATGRETWRREIVSSSSRFHPQLAMADGDVYVSESLPMRSHGRAWIGERVAVFDAAGRIRWRSRVLPTACEDGSDSIVTMGFAVFGAALYVATSGGGLRAFDRESGRELWQRGFFDGEFLDTAPAPATLFRAAIVGRITGARGRPLVRVGDRLVLTDAHGRFSVTLDWRGELSIEVMPRNRLDELPAQSRIDVEHAGRYRIELEQETCDGGCE